MSNNRALILKGNLMKAILVLALPIMLNNLISTFYNLGDAYWVSRLGDIEVAAVNFVWPVTFLISSFALGISVAGASIISQYIGAEKYKQANETASQLFIFALSFGVVFGIIGILITPFIISSMGAEGLLYQASVDYLKILFFELPLVLILNMFLSINQAQGDTLTPTIINGTSAVFNIILDPLFIFTFNLGIKGAAIATVLSKLPFAIYAVYRLSSDNRTIKINLTKLRFIKDKMFELIRIGIPSSVGSCGVALGFMVLNVFVVDYGDYAMAAFGIGNKLNSLAFMPAVGIGAALSTITGQNLGANNPNRVKKAYKLSIMMSFCFLLITSSLLCTFAQETVGVFSNTKEVLDMGVTYLRVLTITTWSISFFNCSIGLFNGSGHTMFSMILDIGRLCVIRIPLIIILGRITDLGHDAVFYSVGISNVASGFIAIMLVMTGIWKKPKVREIAL